MTPSDGSAAVLQHSVTDDRLLLMTSIINYVEARVHEVIDYDDLAVAVGYSLAHVRERVARELGRPLGRYVLERRVAHGAVALVTTQATVRQVAADLAFAGPDQFARAVRRLVGVTPAELRACAPPPRMTQLSTGLFGPAVPVLAAAAPSDESMPDECVLRGVGRVGYGPDSLTPFPACLAALARFHSLPASYEDAMVGSGAAFRLTWDERGWNLGNVDVVFTYDDPTRVYRQGLAVLGSAEEGLWRSDLATREDFRELVVAEILADRPLIALGVVGPPEAGLVTGYRHLGEVLVGWSYFQDNPDLNAGIASDASGHYVCAGWWENPDTLALLPLRPGTAPTPGLGDVLRNAVDALSPRVHAGLARGIAAYGAWEAAVLNDQGFEQSVLQVLAERLFTQVDALDCLADGRLRAAVWLERTADALGSEQESLAQTMRAAARECREVLAVVGRLYEVLGGWQRDEDQMRRFSDRDTRVRSAALIRTAARRDASVLEHLRAAARLAADR